MANLNFNAANVAPSTPSEPVPAGWYVVQMVKSEMKPTSDNTGAYLECEYDILAPHEFAKRKVWDRINLQNKNPAAVEIGYKTLSAICHAVGVIQVEDSAMLHNRPMQAKISLRAAGPGNDGKYYEASNDVKGYKALDTGVPAVTPAIPAAVTPPPAAGGWAPPPAATQAPAPVQAAPAPVPAQAAPQPAVQPWQQPATQTVTVSQPVTAAQPQQPWQQPAPAAAPVTQAAAPVQTAAPVAGGNPPWAAPAPAATNGAAPPWAQQ